MGTGNSVSIFCLKFFMSELIYLDYNATTPHDNDARARTRVSGGHKKCFGNCGAWQIL